MTNAARFKAIAKEVAHDLHVDPDSELCQHVSTLRLLREGLLVRAMRSERVDPDDLLKLDAALKNYLPQGKPATINVNFVKTLTARCPHCHKLSEVSTEPFKDEARQTHPDAATEAAARAAATPAPAPEPPKPENGIGVKGYRQGISGSSIHASVLSNNEVPPLKKLQRSYDTPRRNVSPMSSDGIGDPSPRRPYAPAGSALDEMNPNRSNGRA